MVILELHAHFAPSVMKAYIPQHSLLKHTKHILYTAYTHMPRTQMCMHVLCIARIVHVCMCMWPKGRRGTLLFNVLAMPVPTLLSFSICVYPELNAESSA